jgi:tRNA dimethylallyltransferase
MSSNDASAANRLRVIVGPTAAGKTALALALAAERGAAIISADSRQIYRGFDIGTAKPSPAERHRVLHCGIDVAAPTERWSAARFASAGGEWVDAVHAKGETPVVVGGTGFWISALVAPLAPVPDLDPDRRVVVEQEMAAMSNDELRAWCAALDPVVATRGPAQWRRAIEVALLTGRRLSDWHGDTPASAPRAVRYLLVDPGDAIETHIVTRVAAMFDAGWVDEVRALVEAVPKDAVAWKACGYELLRDAIVSGGPHDQLAADVARETRQYARRQRTWFRRQLLHGPVTRLDPQAPNARARAFAWWDGDDDA